VSNTTKAPERKHGTAKKNKTKTHNSSFVVKQTKENFASFKQHSDLTLQ